jgi:hypothetical protein
MDSWRVAVDAAILGRKETDANLDPEFISAAKMAQHLIEDTI